jgi:probable O-glycosylation ligase (exosortase A-associated)
MIWWLASTASGKKARICWFGVLILNVVAVLFTFSRGGFLTLVFVGLLLLINSQKKVLMIIVIIFALCVGGYFINEKWLGRMDTIVSYEEDRSAMSRLEAWEAAWKFAKQRPFLGGGFEAMSREVYKSLGFETGLVSHSIYFGTLAEQGFLGLGIYLAIFFSSLRSISRYKKIAQNKDIANLLSMIGISLLAFLLGGAFYERQYFDYTFHFIVLLSITKLLIGCPHMYVGREIYITRINS